MPNRIGTRREIRAAKRKEAETRNEKTHPDNRRAHWKAQGFSRKSVAARIVKLTVAEANVIANRIREQTGLPDWKPLEI